MTSMEQLKCKSRVLGQISIEVLLGEHSSGLLWYS